MQESIWEHTALPSYAPLRGDIKTDVLVIGGGLAGILCARTLTDAGVDCVLVEAERLCGGVTGRTTAKITAQHGLIYDTLLQRFGVERTKMYLTAQQEALRQYRRMCRNVDCDFEERDSLVYSRSGKERLERELAALERLGAKADYVNYMPLPFPTAGAVRFRHQAQFHPLKFAAGVLDGLQIYEKTPARELVGRTAVTPHGRIRAEKIIVTTHFPFLNKHGSYFLKLYQHRSYVLALEGAVCGGCMWTRRTQACPSAAAAVSCCWAAAGTVPASRAAAGLNWRPLPRNAIQRRGRCAAGPRRTA